VAPEHTPNGHHKHVPAPVASADLVICTYNRFDDFTLTLGSVLREARRAVEAGIRCVVTVVYQNEGFRERIYAWRPDLEKETLLRFVFSSPPSLTRARNLAIASTDGDLVIFIDDDVLLEPGFVVAHVGAANKHPRAIGVAGQIQAPREEGPFEPRRAVGQIRASGVIETWYDAEERETTLVPLTPMGANMSYRREPMNALFGASWFDEIFDGSAFREESTTAIWIFRRGKYFVFAPDAALYHFESATGGCNNRNSRSLKQWVAHYELNYLFLNNLFAPSELLRLGVPLLHVLRDFVKGEGITGRLRASYMNLKGYFGGRRLFKAMINRE
jgi:glycosyltransferase involved in cell wall biosynthesis